MDSEFELVKRFFDNIETPAYVLDGSGKVLLVNKANLKMYQCSREDFFKFYGNSSEYVKSGRLKSTIFSQVLERREPVASWSELYDTNQKKSLFYGVQYPILDSEGNVKYVVGMNWLYHDFSQMLQKLQQKKIHQEVHLLSGERHTLLYCSKEMDKLVRSLRRVATTSANIMVQGETGTGKDVLANYIHAISPRGKKEIISLNCAAISSSLFESELFGYEAGAFTGAKAKGSVGLIEAAQGSTLFLDEVDSIPLECQGKLLRAIEEKKIRRIGGTKPVDVDFRLIVATNKDLYEEVKAGKFREDLYYRFNVFNVLIPPLRERKDDIRLLANHFLERYCAQYDTQKIFSEEVYQQLESYNWPGNVRELKNIIERAVLTSDIDAVELKHIHIPNTGAEPRMALLPEMSLPAKREEDENLSLEERIDEYEKEILREALAKYDSVTNAASHLNVSISTLSRKIAKYGLKK